MCIYICARLSRSVPNDLYRVSCVGKGVYRLIIELPSVMLLNE